MYRAIHDKKHLNIEFNWMRTLKVPSLVKKKKTTCDGVLLLSTGVCLISHNSSTKMWWDSHSQVGSDGQHPARRTDQSPTAWEAHEHAWTQTEPGSCRLTQRHASAPSRVQLEIAVTQLNLLPHYGFIHYALLDSWLLIFFGSKLLQISEQWSLMGKHQSDPWPVTGIIHPNSGRPFHLFYCNPYS